MCHFSVFIGVIPFASFRLSFHMTATLAMLWCSISGYLSGSLLVLQVDWLNERLFVVQRDFFARVPLFNEMITLLSNRLGPPSRSSALPVAETVALHALRRNSKQASSRSSAPSASAA